MNFHFLRLRLFFKLALAPSTHFAPGKDNTAWIGAYPVCVFRMARCEGLITMWVLACQEICHVTLGKYQLVISLAASPKH